MGNEKGINGYLYDQLTLVERIRRAIKRGDVEEELDDIEREINRKLYQTPPLTDNK